ncbi:MAG: cupredoxin family copper-binding protein [Ignavibacteriales bacterium]
MKKILLAELFLMTLAFVFAISLTSLGFVEKEEVNQTAGSGKNQSASNQVNIDNFSFTPPTLTIQVGTKVTWINHDDVPHIIMNTDKHFVSPVLDTDEKFSYTFTSPGTYTYYCSIHPKMTAKIIVH